MRRKYRHAEELFAEKGYAELATFNGERARGIMHTPEWVAQMAEVQERFDAEQREAFGPNTVVFPVSAHGA